VKENIKGIILQQSRGGIQQLNSRRLLIKPYISSDNDLSFDMIKQSIGFRLFSVSHHDASMTLCIQLISAIIENMIPDNTSKHTEVAN
jgi:hypothetical protein